MQILAFVEGDWPDEHSVVPDHRAFLLKYGTLGELREPGSKSPRPPFDSAVVNSSRDEANLAGVLATRAIHRTKVASGR
jgi:hypothetical protein